MSSTHCVSILPLAVGEGTGPRSLNELARGLASMIEGRLRQVPGIHVFVQHMIFAPGGEPEAAGFVTRNTMWSAEEALGLPMPEGLQTTHVLHGRLSWGDEIELIIQVLHRESRELVFHHTLQAVPNRFVERFFDIIGRLAVTLGADANAPAFNAIRRQPTESIEAFCHYLEGVARVVASQLPVARPDNEDLFQPFLNALESDADFREPCLAINILAQECLRDSNRPPENAIRALRHGCVRAPNYAGFRGTLGTYLFESGRYEEARRMLEEFVQNNERHDDDSAGAIVRLASIYHRSGHLKRAFRVLRAASAKYPRDPDVLESLGVCHAEMGELAKAESSWRRALDEDPRRSTALSGLGAIHWQRGEHEKARIFLERSVEGPEVAPLAWPRWIDFLLERGELTAADNAATEWTEQNADNWRAWVRLGLIRRARGQMRTAEWCLSRAEPLVNEDDDPASEFEKARFSIQHASDYDLFRMLMTARPREDDQTPTTPGGDADPVKRHMAGIIMGLRNLTDRHPQESFLWGALSDKLIQMGQTESAIEAQRRLVAIKPRLATAHNTLGVLLARASRRSEAVAHFHRAVELAPRQVSYRTNLATALIEDGALEQAIVQLHAAEALAPTDRVVTALIAQAEHQLHARTQNPETPAAPSGILQKLIQLLRRE